MTIAPDMRGLKVTRLLFALSAVAGAVVVLLVLSTGIGSHGSNRALGYGAGLLLFGVFGFLYVWLSPKNTRLLIGTGEVGYQDMLGRRRVWSTGQIARVVDVTINYRGRYGAIPRRTVLLIGVDGRCLFALNVRPWSTEAVGEFIAGTGRDGVYRDEALTVKQAATEFPGAIPWMYLHTTWMVVITIAVVIVAGLAFFVLYEAVFSR
jgi:hypothetical protein